MADRTSSSAGTTGGTMTGGRSGATVRSYSGQGRTVNNLIFLVLAMAVMIGSFWAFASYPNSPTVWIIGLLLYALALLIPVSLMSSSTAKRAEGGRTLAMDVPPSTEVPGDEPKAAQLGQAPRDPARRDAEVRAEHGDDALGRTTQ
ncbi:hypothetical protein AUQ48_14365 [Kocuria flava]|uniref:Uncharacterized protein n=1 Tax=Kocuria flava TaxID=446860 RepID=A0A2N4T4M6_9MICC|nr:hypothetical protein [Kocuria flava]PLC13180.1 hypothetical protein AUQ48_14365 [Kocuria flava]